MKTATQLATRLGSSSGSVVQRAFKVSQTPKRSICTTVTNSLDNEKRSADKLNSLSAVLTTASTLTVANSAQASDGAPVVDNTVNAIIEIVKAAGDATKASISAAQSGVEAAQQAYEAVAPAVKTAVDVAAPVLKGAVDVAAPVVGAGVKAASSVVQEAKPTLEKALSSTGIETATIETTAKQAVATSKPLLDSLITFLTTSSPTTLAEVAVGLVAAYYLLPPALKVGVGALRGYAGDVSAAAALDALATRGDAVLLDIRTAREKEQAGIPDLPNSGKLVELEYATIEDRRIRGQLRNISDLELKITAMQAAALKRLSKGSTIYVMDRNGSTSKAIAKELARRGFGKVFVINGGFGGWSSAKLGTKLSQSVSRVEVLMPGSFRSGSTKTGSAKSGSVQQLPPVQARRALPSSTGQ